jgi:hypothetical protein
MKRIFTIIVFLLLALNASAQYTDMKIRMPNSPYLKIVQIDFREVNTLVYMQYSNVESTEAICISRGAYIEIERSKYRLLNAHNVPLCGQTTPPNRSIFNFVLEFEKTPAVAEFDIVEPLGWFNIFGIKIDTTVKVSFLDVGYFVGSYSPTPADVAYYSPQVMQPTPYVAKRAVGKVDKGRRRYIGLSAGASIPVGNFGSKSPDNPDAGLAKIGPQINLMDFGFLFSKHVGIAGKWFGSQYDIDDKGFDEPWTMGGIVLGPLFALPTTSEVVSIDLRPFVGYGIVVFPESIYSDSSVAGTDMFGAGLTIRINAAPKLALLIGVDYLYANPEFDVVGSGYSLQGMKQPISVVTASFGIAISWTK